MIFIGNTAAGKSTLVHWMQDPSKVESCFNDTSFTFYIKDHLDTLPDKASITESRTLIPEFITTERGTVLYDCPGFFDTRNTTVEITSSILLIKVLENMRGIKFVIILNHDSISQGGTETISPC